MVTSVTLLRAEFDVGIASSFCAGALMTDRMILSAFFFNPQGDHRAAWRHPLSPGKDVLGLDYYRRIASLAESAAFDLLFIADEVAVWDQFDSALRHHANLRLEPFTLASALAAQTSHIGLLCTASTTYNEPFHIARKFASLDFISGGRAAWNIVTSEMREEALNFNLDAPLDHGLRYARAVEFVEVTKRLWASWDDGAWLYDKETGDFADPEKVHRLDHKGSFFSVRGPLNLPRCPQGRPVLVQAGSSEAGRRLAAQYAELQFTAFRSAEDGRSYRETLNTQLAEFGRLPGELKTICGVMPVVGANAAEVDAKLRQLESLIPGRLAIDLLSYWSGIDLSLADPGGPLPALPDESTFKGSKTILRKIRDRISEGPATVAELARLCANTGFITPVIGTPADVAQTLSDWFRSGGADGFNLMFPLLEEDLAIFVRDVIPILIANGAARASYPVGATLRERLGFHSLLHHV